MRVLTITILLGLTLGWLVQPGWSYEETNVVEGGVIRGKVTIEGAKPRPMAFNLVTIPDAVFCGRISTGTGWRIVEDFIIGPNKELKDVVVTIKDAKKGKPFKLPPVRIESRDCDFIPFVNVLRDFQEITVVNLDPVEHDIQGYETARMRGARVLFNRPLPMSHYQSLAGMISDEVQYLEGEPMVERIHLKRGRNLFVMQCGFHPYMFSWGVVVKNPYNSITKEDGLFEITGIVPGEYTLAAWHAGVGEFIEQKVTVPPNGTVAVNFVFQAPQGRRSVHEMEENPRFSMELLGEGVEIVPSIRKQEP